MGFLRDVPVKSALFNFLIRLVCSLLQYFALRGLWVAKIHHLVQQFIDNDKVIPDTFFFQHLKVFRKHLHDLVEEEEDLRRIGIPLGQRKNVEVAVSDIEVLQNQHLLEIPVKHV